MLVFTGKPEIAIKLVEDLYKKDVKAVDGFARLGWANYLLTADMQYLNFLVKKDIDLNRLSVDGHKIKAMTMINRGELIQANLLIESLYYENPHLKDGFAAMGWHFIEKREIKKGISLIEKDYRMDRLSPIWKINYVYQLLKLGESQKAHSVFNEVMAVEPYRQEFCIGYQLNPLKIISKQDLEQMVNGSVSTDFRLQ